MVVAAEKNFFMSFEKSNAMREDARKLIPLGAHTFTRSYTQFPYNFSPLFITKGKGAHFWDVDGNEYVDMLSGLLSVILGYCDPDVDRAIIDQLGNGITFSLSTELEQQLARVMIDTIPSAEMVRFGKNGSDCTSAAIRLARHVTKRDHVLVCGYHGWHDWYAGVTSMHAGIPSIVSGLSHSFDYNNIESLQKLFAEFPGQVAAVIMEPMNIDQPKDDFLAKVKELAHANGALLIFDEVITGFRFDIGGAQKLFNVTPDLSIFGKAMANGMPLSALVGKAEYMRRLEEVFYSSTFAPETLSLAASLATIKKIKEHDVIGKIRTYGGNLRSRVNDLIKKYELDDLIAMKGDDSWVIATFKEHPKASRTLLRTFFQKEMISQGVFILVSHNINYAHTEKDFAQIVAAYDHTLSKLRDQLDQNKLLESLNTQLLEPVFSVRKT